MQVYKNQLKFIVLNFVLILFSCENKDEKMCECLKISEELNVLSNKILNQNTTEKELLKMKTLRKIKNKKCANFKLMSGEEMLRKKNMCQE